MRIAILLAAAILASGCANKQSAREKAEPIVKYGLIVAREAAEMEEVRSRTQVDTSFHASISTGSGLSIGLGFLLSPLLSNETRENPIRYEIDLIDGSRTTIYHLSSLFEIGDCVEITVYPDEKEHPPAMVRSQDGCDP